MAHFHFTWIWEPQNWFPAFSHTFCFSKKNSIFHIMLEIYLTWGKKVMSLEESKHQLVKFNIESLQNVSILIKSERRQLTTLLDWKSFWWNECKWKKKLWVKKKLFRQTKLGKVFALLKHEPNSFLFSWNAHFKKQKVLKCFLANQKKKKKTPKLKSK